MTPAEGRKFGLTVGAAFAVLMAIGLWRDHVTVPAVLGTIAGLLVLGGLLVPGRMGPVYDRWMAFAVAISKVTTPIFMSLVYFLVLTPAGIVVRAFGHRPLRAQGSDGGFWVRKPEGQTRSDLSRQF